ncbi:DNA damage-inducible protein 1, partial [Tanacetum coccineum]
MKITVMTADEQILTLEVDPNESVENMKALLEIESRVPLQQQQLLYNGKEMRNNETLSGLGVADGDLVMMVSHTSSAPPASSQVALNPDGSAANPAAFQQQIRNNADVMAQLFQSDPELAQVILGNDLNKLQIVLRARHNQRSEFRRQEEEEMHFTYEFCSNLLFSQNKALLYADPFDVEAQKKIEAAIRQ